MYATKRNVPRTLVAAVIVILFAVGSAAADLWISVTPQGTVGLERTSAAAAPEVRVTAVDEAGLVVAVDTRGLVIKPRATKRGDFVELTWPDASVAGRVGTPAIPVVRRLFRAPAGATVTVRVQIGEALGVDSATARQLLRLIPVQPPLPKIPGAQERAVFHFDGEAYGVDADGPAQRATVQELGIIRGQRLFLLEVRPVAYNPVAQTLTMWPTITAEIEFSGGHAPTHGLAPLPGVNRILLNPEPGFDLQRGSGNYLIVVASAYESPIADFAAAKQAQGFTVHTYSVPPGTSNTTIKSYIQSLWGGPDSPDYVLLVGDTDTVPYWTGGGSGSPPTDLPYVCMDGSSDWYPDIASGRFPVRSISQLAAIVDKTLYYEDGPLGDPGYVNRAVFMASEDNYWISEGTHNWVISHYMVPNEIISDKLYCHTYNATTQDVRDSFNDGRFFGIYSGHGGTTSWGDGPPFYQSDVNNLVNESMYAFVCSFACYTGNYTSSECFMETWVRAPNKGALAAYGSTVTSYWTEDDVLEKRLFDAIYDENDDVYSELGPVWISTLMRYLAEMGPGSTTRRYFEMYNLMGDPSLCFPNAGPVPLKIKFPDGLPEVLPPGQPTDIIVQIAEGDEQYVPQSGTLYYRFYGGVYQTAGLVPLGGDLCQATLPGTSCDATPEYYFSAEGTESGIIYQPPGAPGAVFTAAVGEITVVMEDDFNSAQGWTVENSGGLTDGAWQRGIPAGGGDRGDPPSDYDGSGWCYVTDNADGNSDVDDGYTWLISPTIDVSDADAIVHYALWYTNNYGNDPNNDLFKTYVSNDNGANWVPAETVGPQTPGSEWIEHSFRVADFVTPTAQVKVRFEASDLNAGSVVEAGIDAFAVTTFDCEDVCPGDLDGDGDTDQSDLGILLASFGVDDGGDLDGDGDTDQSDLGILLADFGCGTGP